MSIQADKMEAGEGKGWWEGAKENALFTPKLERKTSSVVKEAKRRKSVVRVAVEAFEEKHKTAFKVLGWAKSIVAEGLYFSDVTTDVLLCVTFYTFKHYGWFQIMLTFLILPNLVAMGGIAYYVCKEGIDWPLYLLLLPLFSNVGCLEDANDYFVYLLTLLWLPIGLLICFVLWGSAPFFLDLLMPFYRPLQDCLPDKLVTFMVQYEATRTLSENMLESVPQMALQVQIFFYCAGQEDMCAGITQEAGTALIYSMIISGASILFHLVQVSYEMKKEGLGFCGYLKSLMTMGAGLPLKAITNNAIEKLDLDDQELLPAQVRLLAAAIGNNKSLRRVELNRCNIDDEGARHLATMLEKNTSLERLNLSRNKITDVGLKHLAIPLEKNTSLEYLYLSNNKITDDGLKHLAIPLEKNTSLKELDLRSNKITDDGLKHLAIPLEKNTSLKWLSLSYNKITDDNLKRKLKDIWNKTKGRKDGLHF